MSISSRSSKVQEHQTRAEKRREETNCCFTVFIAAIGMTEFVVNFLQQVLSLLAKLVDLVVEGSRVGQGQVLEDGIVTVSKEKMIRKKQI